MSFLSRIIAPLALVLSAAAASAALEVGQAAPELSGTWKGSQPDMRGRVVLVEFWRTW
jgi:hypothetical protein